MTIFIGKPTTWVFGEPRISRRVLRRVKSLPGQNGLCRSSLLSGVIANGP